MSDPHPPLYSGIDDWGIALDEINGAGVNDKVFVDLINALEIPLSVIVNSSLTVECPDLQVGPECREFMLPAECRTYCVGDP